MQGVDEWGGWCMGTNRSGAWSWWSPCQEGHGNVTGGLGQPASRPRDRVSSWSRAPPSVGAPLGTDGRYWHPPRKRLHPVMYLWRRLLVSSVLTAQETLKENAVCAEQVLKDGFGADSRGERLKNGLQFLSSLKNSSEIKTVREKKGRGGSLEA